MPLPAALQARLFKRGIVKTRSERNITDLFTLRVVGTTNVVLTLKPTDDNNIMTNVWTTFVHLPLFNHKATFSRLPTEPDEEIIAENYDDQQSRNEPSEKGDSVTNNPVPIVTPTPTTIRVAPGCPNKWNIFHECTKFCFDRWGEGKRVPDLNDEKKRMKMVQRYPVPKNWDEIYDPGTGRYYYWNTLTDEVSWLPPLHPKAKVTLPASKLREIQKGKENSKPSEDVEMVDVSNNKNANKSGESSEADKHRSRRWDSRKNRHEGGGGGGGGRSVKKSNDLDPMDPASYSDIPRGTWSTGLERQGEAKTGADTTASGPLYQMRPYPSPGAVLRANAEIHKK